MQSINKPIYIDDWYTASQAASQLSIRSGREIKPTYPRQLGYMGKVATMQAGTRLTLYKKSDIDAYTVEGKGVKAARINKARFPKKSQAHKKTAMMNKPTGTRTRTRTRGQRMRRCERRDMKRMFLAAFAACPVVRTTCRTVGIARTAFYGWLATDAPFKHKYQCLIYAHFEPQWEGMNTEEQEEFRKKRRYGLWLRWYYTRKPTEMVLRARKAATTKA